MALLLSFLSDQVDDYPGNLCGRPWSYETFPGEVRDVAVRYNGFLLGVY